MVFGLFVTAVSCAGDTGEKPVGELVAQETPTSTIEEVTPTPPPAPTPETPPQPTPAEQKCEASSVSDETSLFSIHYHFTYSHVCV